MRFYSSGALPKVPHMFFVYGDGGTGKTSLFRQFDGKKLLFSFDMSTNVIKPEDDTDVMMLDSGDEATIQKQLPMLLNRSISSGKYQAIALDNVTSLQNYVLENIDDASKDGRQNYQKLQLWFRQLGMMLRNSGLTVYATAHQVNVNEADINGNGQFKPDMNDKVFNAFTSTFDLVGRIYKHEGQRMIDLDPEQGNHAKNRIDERTLINADELLNPAPLTENKPKKDGKK